MPFCSSCGSVINEGNKFCSKCGNPVNNSISQNPQAPSQGVSSLSPELIKMANEGDTEAMVKVAEYYSNLDENNRINGKAPQSIAHEWYEKAALAGHAGAASCISYIRFRELVLLQSSKGLTDPEVINRKRNVYKWFRIGYKLYLRKSDGYELIAGDLDKYIKDMNKARCWLAYSLFFQKSYDEALSYVSGREDFPSLILESLISCTTAKIHFAESNDEKYVDDYINAAMDLVITNDPDYRAAQKDCYEEMIFVLAARELASALKAEGAIDAAFGNLCQIRTCLKDDVNISLIEKELSHFKRDGSGELLYVE